MLGTIYLLWKRGGIILVASDTDRYVKIRKLLESIFNIIQFS
jgi:hypothetical protein